MKQKKGGIYNMTETVVNNLYECNNIFGTTKQKSNIILDNFITALSFYRLKKQAKKIDYSNLVEKREDFCGGNVIIKNTRIMPETIFNVWISKVKESKDCDTCLEEIKKEYPALTDNTIIIKALFYYISHNSYRKIFK
ncbi:MAG: hypothetical protein MR598_03420 [Erysipelotrichaceae bacterium]|nr:hypothetical protein [Erysipelotrichaceae bacterium]